MKFLKILLEFVVVTRLVNVSILYIIRDLSFQDNAIIIFLLVVCLVWGFSLGYRDGSTQKAKKP